VMEEVKLLCAGFHGDLHDIVHTTVAPPDVALVFFAVVLSVENEHVHPAQEFDELAGFAGGVSFARGFAGGGAGLMLEAMGRFVVREKGEGTFRRGEPVADADARVIGEEGFNADRAEREIKVTQFINLDVAGQLLEADGEVGAFHLARQDFEQTAAGTLVAEDADAVVRAVERLEKGQALDVIPMRVGQQDVQGDGLFAEFAGQFAAEGAQPGAGVEDDDLAAAADFDAGGVAAVMNGGRTPQNLIWVPGAVFAAGSAGGA